MKTLRLFAAFSLGLAALSVQIFAQNGAVATSFAGSGISQAAKIVQLSDGGFLAVGSDKDQSDVNHADIVAIRYGADLKPMWGKSYGSAYSSNAFCLQSPHVEYGIDAVETNDAFFVLGSHDRNDGLLCVPGNEAVADMDFCLMKIKKTGEPIWTKRYGSLGKRQNAYGILATSDGGFLLSGNANADNGILAKNWPYFVKVDADGNIQWTKVQRNVEQFGLAGAALVAARRFPVIELSSGGFLYAASDGKKTYLVKMKANGGLVWAKRFSTGDASSAFGDNWGLGAASSGAAIGLAELPDGGFAVLSNYAFLFLAGFDEKLFGAYFPFCSIAEFDANGVCKGGVAFSHSNDNPGNPNLVWDLAATSFKRLPNGHYLVCGLTESKTAALEIALDGQPGQHAKWARKLLPYQYAGVPYHYDLPSMAAGANHVSILSDRFDIIQVGIDGSSTACAQAVQVGSVSYDPFTVSDATGEMDFVILSTTGPLDLKAKDLLQLSSTVNCAATAAAQNSSETKSLISGFSIFPNPLSEGATAQVRFESEGDEAVVCSIADVSGRLLFQEKWEATTGENFFEMPRLSSKGIYFVRLSSKTSEQALRLIKNE